MASHKVVLAIAASIRANTVRRGEELCVSRDGLVDEIADWLEHDDTSSFDREEFIATCKRLDYAHTA